MIDRMPELIAEAKASAAVVEHPWDAQALDWPLTMNSVVVEVGGYKGRWALQIAERYPPRLFVFEPQVWAADVCRAVLGDRATVGAFGLGDRNDVLQMGEWETDGCSFTKGSGTDRYGKMREIREVFEFFDITDVDLMLINIEGYEYTLIPHMLKQGIRPRWLMVQLHGDMIDISGYRVLWTYGQVLTAWEKI